MRGEDVGISDISGNSLWIRRIWIVFDEKGEIMNEKEVDKQVIKLTNGLVDVVLKGAGAKNTHSNRALVLDFFDSLISDAFLLGSLEKGEFQCRINPR